MRHRVTVLRRDSTLTSPTGALIGEWLPVAAIGVNGVTWAGVEPVNGREIWNGASYAAEANQKIYMRYWAALKRTDRIRWEGRDYEILDMIDIKNVHKEFEIPVKWVQDMGDGAINNG